MRTPQITTSWLDRGSSDWIGGRLERARAYMQTMIRNSGNKEGSGDPAVDSSLRGNAGCDGLEVGGAILPAASSMHSAGSADLAADKKEVADILRRLPGRVPPPELTTRLRILASKERQRAARRQSWRSAFAAWQQEFRLTVRNLMRPLAVPFAGGIVSAVALFSMWVVPAYPIVTANHGTDVPTGLSTVVTVAGTSTIGSAVADLIVEISVDEQGRMVDYTVVNGEEVMNRTARRNLENMLLFTRFVPATSFGQPTAGKVRILTLARVSSNQVDVRADRS